jgi:RNA polymerase sigma-70 factor (ECF subfamily)
VVDDTDEALVARYQRGDVAAFETLLDRHRQGVFRFLLRFVGDAARAEDLTQDCWMRFIGAAPRWKATGRFKTWLYAVARNVATDAARRAVHRDHEPLEPSAGRRGHDGVETAAGPVEGDVLLRAALEHAIAALPADQREVFLLREYEGLSFAEVAEVTGALLPTVKSRMRYALESLRSALDGAGHAAPGAATRTPAARSARP